MRPRRKPPGLASTSAVAAGDPRRGAGGWTAAKTFANQPLIWIVIILRDPYVYIKTLIWIAIILRDPNLGSHGDRRIAKRRPRSRRGGGGRSRLARKPPHLPHPSRIAPPRSSSSRSPSPEIPRTLAELDPRWRRRARRRRTPP